MLLMRPVPPMRDQTSRPAEPGFPELRPGEARRLTPGDPMTATPPPVPELLARSADDAAHLYLHLLGEVRLAWGGVITDCP